MKGQFDNRNFRFINANEDFVLHDCEFGMMSLFWWWFYFLYE